MGKQDLKIYALFVTSLMHILMQPSVGLTNAQDVSAIISLYRALGMPPLPHWRIEEDSDPCLEGWQGVGCQDLNITSIVINGANLQGQLGDSLMNFLSIKTIDLSNNHIGGSIPNNLPTTMTTFFLSANQFIGSIPASLSSLTLLTAMSLNNNLLTGELPDAFQNLNALINLDLSFNNLSGVLPQSLKNLSSLTTLHMQNNQLHGTLDVLEDLPIKELNIQNNLFTGPIPEKMMSIPNFIKDGNLFNTTISPSPSPLPSTPPTNSSEVPPESPVPVKPSSGPSSEQSKRSRKSGKIILTVVFVVLGVILFAAAILVVIKCCEEKSKFERTSTRPEIGLFRGTEEEPRGNNSLIEHDTETKKVPKELIQKEPKETQRHTIGMENVLQDSPGQYGMDMSGVEVITISPAEKDTTLVMVPAELPKDLRLPASVTCFTVGSLQQYTSSFGPGNLIGVGMLGSVYLAELPNGQLLAVKKLESTLLQDDESFLNLVSSVSKLQHPNIVKLVGYCIEHKQRLLVYEYCSGGTLPDVIHSVDELTKTLSWNERIQIALGAARALEYLHEGCQPPIVHRNFKSANLLLHKELLSVHVSDCGLAPLISSGSARQLSGNILSSLGYGAPEFIQSGIYTCQSDVYSYGVVMLELLTGRTSYDSSLPRGEQHLTRWAMNQLHDISLLSKMVDSSLSGKYPEKSLSQFADIISICIQSEPEFRPPMSEIVQKLLRMKPRDSLGEEI